MCWCVCVCVVWLELVVVAGRAAAMRGVVHGGSLLGCCFQPSSSTANRTVLPPRTTPAAQGVLSGLFPGTAHPITVHTTEEIDEVLYTNVKSCGRLHQLMQDLHRQQRGEGAARGWHAALGVQPSVPRGGEGLVRRWLLLAGVVWSGAEMQHLGLSLPGLLDYALLCPPLAASRSIPARSPACVPAAAAEASELGADPAVEAVQQRVRAALGLPADHRVSFVELHDAMTSMQTHGKEVPPGEGRGWVCCTASLALGLLSAFPAFSYADAGGAAASGTAGALPIGRRCLRFRSSCSAAARKVKFQSFRRTLPPTLPRAAGCRHAGRAAAAGHRPPGNRPLHARHRAAPRHRSGLI